jgi:glycosyltransferase involved in cell wall biosynthesis
VTATVSVVIPTIGRPSLARAVESALNQTLPVAEVIVVADTDQHIALPPDDRVRLLRNRGGGGAARCRQVGIDAAQGTVTALLDDDDEWHTTKLAKQLEAVGAVTGDKWVASSRMLVLGPGDRRRIWPRRLIEPGELISAYLFRFVGMSAGGAVLQSSTLCFPTALGREIRWDEYANGPHDEPSWLISVQRQVPDISIVVHPEVLSIYNVAEPSMSRHAGDRTDDYIEWGLQYLAEDSPRVLGDYLCTSPVSAAVAAKSLDGVWRSVRSGMRYGQPGMFALLYAAMNGARIVARSAAR